MNEPIMCEWFALCTRVAEGVVRHPIIGAVPTCACCAEKLYLTLEPFPEEDR